QLVGDEAVPADEGGAVVDLADEAFAGGFDHIAGGGEAQPGHTGGLHQRGGHHMAGGLIEAGGDAQHLIGGDAGNGADIGDFGVPAGQGAGLVEHGGLYLGQG